MRVSFDSMPDLSDADMVVGTFRQLFPEPGDYTVAKAAGAAMGEGPFEVWFMDALERKANGEFLSHRDQMWQVLDELLSRSRVRAPSDLDLWDLRQRMLDLSGASTAQMVGLQIPDQVRERLEAIGWQPREVLDFPGWAYRFGMIHKELVPPGQMLLPFAAEPVPWGDLLELAGSKPLTAIETASIDHARRRAGNYLTNVFDEAVGAWTSEREIEPLRRMTASVIRDRSGVLEAARHMRNSNRAKGIVRNAERVMRTEISEARCRGSWAEDKFAGDEQMFRIVSANPCKHCLRLYVLPDGTPRPYGRADLEALSVDVNRGPAAEWTAKIGPTHPHCLCGIWLHYNTAFLPMFEEKAPEYRALLARKRVFEEAA